jgi:hypothetical protein
VDSAPGKLESHCAAIGVPKHFVRGIKHFVRRIQVRGTPMNQPDSEFDYSRYRKLLAEAVDEPRRLALINLLIEERARDRLAAQATQQRIDVIRGMIAPRDLADARSKSG